MGSNRKRVKRPKDCGQSIQLIGKVTHLARKAEGMSTKEPDSRWTDLPSRALITDGDGNVIYPTDPKDQERAVVVQAAWAEFWKTGSETKLRDLGVIE